MGAPSHCYRVVLPTTNSASDVADLVPEPHKVGDAKFVRVESGVLFVVSDSLEAVARTFPTATQITRIGVGYAAPSVPGPHGPQKLES